MLDQLIISQLREIVGNKNVRLSDEDLTDYGMDRTTIWTACLLYTSPSPRDLSTSRMPSSA